MKKLLVFVFAAAWLGMGAPAQRATPAPNGASAPGALAPPLPERIIISEASSQKILLKIMPLGDSITFGSPDPSYGGYRHLLGTLLSNDGYSIAFVGSRQSGNDVIPGPGNEGHPGWTIAQIKSGMDSEGWLATYQPDIILLHIGRNDLREGNAVSAPDHLSALLDDILERLQRTHVIVAQIIPFRRGLDEGHQSYNAAIARIVASKGPRVSMADMQNILSPNDYADGLHPNAVGYDKMARAWESATCALFANNWAPSSRAAGQSVGSSPAKKPNIVFILADDLSSNLVPYMPNLLAIQKEGTTFSNYFVTDSLCCPSRSSIFTGEYPHNTGVFTNVEPDGGYGVFLKQGNESHTFAVALQRNGYKTAMLGKYLNGYIPARSGVPQGWNEWDVAGDGYPEFNYNLNQNGRIVHYGNSPQDYLTDVVAGLGEAFMRKSAQGPFFVEIATFAPHAPYIPAPRDADKFPELSAPRSAAFAVHPDANAPNWLKEIRPLLPVEIRKIDQEFRMRAQSVQAIDKMIGDIRATLAALGADNTYVVFSSDNGLHMGEYSLRPGKQTPFDIDIRVPLIVVGPGVAKGQVVNAIAENVDLFATFTDIAEASSSASTDGHSLLPLLRGNTAADWRNVALIEHHRPRPDPSDPDAPAPHAGNPTSYEALRTGNALYVEYESEETGYYDLSRDPLELKNIASKLPAAKRKQLHEVLLANKACQGAQACWSAQHMTPESGSPH